MATTPYTYGRFIGRVGALAVALGIGAAIANSPGIAAADDGQSDTSGSGSTSGTSSATSSSESSSTSSSSSTSTSSSSTNDDTAETDPSSTPSTNDDEKSSTTRETKTSKPESTVTAQTVTISNDSDTLTAETTLSQPTVSVPPSSATMSTPTPDPGAPVQSLGLLSMVGTARRELGQAAAPTSTDATPAATQTASTSQSVSTAAASPLGTPEQLAAERLAAETVNTLPVQLMKFVLQFGWLSIAQQQFSLVGGPDQENIALLNMAVDEYAMGAAFQQQLLNSNDPTVVMQVAPPHTWYGQDVGGSRILYDNPDTIYRFMGVNKASSYVITGRFAGGIPADTTFSVLTGLSGSTAAVLSGRDLEVNPDGTFTITASGSPAAPGQKNHLQLTSDSTLIATRNTLSDWNTQEPMSLSIERISGPPNSLFSQFGGFAIPFIGPLVVDNPLLTTLVSLIPPLPNPPPLLRGAVTAVVMALGLQMESKYIAVATTDPTTGERRQPNVLTNPTRNAEFLATQLQSAGYFQLTDQQALVVTIDPGNASYFVVPVTNDWTITDNYWDQQTSLNIAQAVLNDDGTTYTLVISPTDPGVANWVSTGGLNQGTISIRFQDLDMDSTNLPTVSSQLVSLDQLPTVLPAGTDYVTPQQRQDQIALRKAGFNKRFAPYPQP